MNTIRAFREETGGKEERKTQISTAWERRHATRVRHVSSGHKLGECASNMAATLEVHVHESEASAALFLMFQKARYENSSNTADAKGMS